MKRRRMQGESLEDRLLMTFDFRTIDGVDNNQTPGRQNWGVADSILIRNNYPGGYPDGFGDVIIGEPQIPNARDISNAVFAQHGSLLNDRNLSDWIVQWGQFLTHDLDLAQNGAEFDELFNGGTGDFSIPINDANDPLGPNPISLHRTQYDPRTGTPTPIPVPGMPPRPNWREQINSVTSFIDASNVYGSNETRADELRTFVDGKLKTTANGLLPGMNTAGLQNDDPFGQGAGQFLVGDVRGNEQIGLTATHALFVREHNRLAGLLKQFDGNLLDEEIYQITRKIVGAEMQIVTYSEFLPALIGNAAPNPNQFNYNPNVNPAITNSFAASFFRYGHSMQSPELLMVDDNGTQVDALALRDIFFNPTILANAPGVVEQTLKGLAVQVAQENDVLLIDDVRNFLFGPPGAGGLDLGALDVQRGRDHGLLDFNGLRIAYGLPPINSFNQLTSDPQLAAALQSLYGGMRGFDSFVGAIAEDHAPGTSVGAMVRESIRDQFTRLRDGDRYFYAGDADLEEPTVVNVIDLNSVSLSQIIRWNTSITNIQGNVFFATNEQPTLQVESVDFNDAMPDPADRPTGIAPTSWILQRSQLANVTVQFNRPVNITLDDIQLTCLGIDAPNDANHAVDLSTAGLGIDDATVTLDLTGVEIPDGAFRLELSGAVTDWDGSALDGNGDGTSGDSYFLNSNTDNRFYQLAGEWNGDGGVSVFDFSSFSYWFGVGVPLAPHYVDLNDDGGVSVFDFSGFSSNFGQSIQHAAPFSSRLSDQLLAELSEDVASSVPLKSQDAIAAAKDQAVNELLFEWTQKSEQFSFLD